MSPEQAVAALKTTKAMRASKKSHQIACARAGEASIPPFKLTKRERDVIWHLAQGRTNAQIAQELVITPTTVNAYLRTIYRKLDVTSRTGAIRVALNYNLI